MHSTIAGIMLCDQVVLIFSDAAARHLQQWRHQCAPTQVNQVIRHPRTTFGAVIVNVNKRSVSADARTFTPNYLLGVDLFNSKRTVEG